jgi:hypothetical protein
LRVVGGGDENAAAVSVDPVLCRLLPVPHPTEGARDTRLYLKLNEWMNIHQILWSYRRHQLIGEVCSSWEI